MPLHVWDHVTTPVSPAWSPPVATGNVWVRNGVAWSPTIGLWAYQAVGGWTQFYAGFASFPPTIKPAGTTSVVGASTVNLNLTNRQPQWRVQGTQKLFDFGAQVQSQTIDLASDGPFEQTQLGISTTGEVQWNVNYFDPASGASGPSQLFSIFF